MFQRSFSSWASQPTHCAILIRGCRSFYFHSLIESTIFVSNGFLCWHKKQNNTCLRVDMKFLFSCSTRHLARSLCSLVSCRVKHSKRNSISTCTHVLIFIYHINRGAIQGFPALRKAVKTHVKNIVFFHVCRYSQSAADTSLAFGATRSGWWMNGKVFTILNTSCLSELSWIMAAKTLKIPYRWQLARFKLS